MIGSATRSRKPEPLGAIIARIFRGAGEHDPVADYPLELLLLLSPTEQLRTERDILAAALEQPVPDELANSREIADHRRKLGIRLQAANLRLRRGERRDEIQLGRPDGCWCLGLRGRREAFVTYEHGVDREGKPQPWLVRGQDGEPIAGFGEYCVCPDGRELQVANGELATQAANQHRAKSVASLWDGVGIPNRSADATLDGWRSLVVRRGANPADADRVVSTLRSWLASDRWLVLWGPVGRGKTGLAAALVKELAEQGKGVLFRTVPDLLDRLKATYGADGEGRESDLLTALYEVDVLVLDDVGVDGPTDWSTARLFRIVNQRYDAGRRTILTSNIDQAALAKYLTARNFDRLRQMTGGAEGFVALTAFPNLRDRSSRRGVESQAVEELPL